MPHYQVTFPTVHMYVRTDDVTRPEAEQILIRTVTDFIKENLVEIPEIVRDPDEVIVTGGPIQEMLP